MHEATKRSRVRENKVNRDTEEVVQMVMDWLSIGS
jgi:hypothetical protein